MINKEGAMAHLMDLLAVEGPTGQESKVVETITKKLITAGCKKAWIKTDDAHKRLGDGYEIGNLIVKLPGTVKAPRVMFSAHMDTVPLCKGAVPLVKGNRIIAKGKTGLGGDDRSGCAAIVTLAETLLKNKIPHPPITLLFPIAEENGLHGSRMVRFKDLGHPEMGFNLDGQHPNEIVIGAMSAVRWTAEVSGLSTHAGIEPQKGISAGLIASKAMATGLLASDKFMTACASKASIRLTNALAATKSVAKGFSHQMALFLSRHKWLYSIWLLGGVPI